MSQDLPRPNGLILEARDSGERDTSETRLRFGGAPPDLETEDLWNMFHKEGEIRNITLFKRSDGTPNGEGSIYFENVNSSFLKRRSYRANVPRLSNRTVILHLRFETPQMEHYPHIANAQSCPPRKALYAHTLTFGVMRSPTSAQIMSTVLATENIPIALIQNAEHREITITFPLRIAERCINQFKISLTYTSSLSARELDYSTTPHQRTLVLSVDNVPSLYLKREESKSHTAGASNWNRNRTWLRKTEISNGSVRKTLSPTRLRNQGSRIDIASWRVYCLTFRLIDSKAIENYVQFCQMLEDFNVKLEKCSKFSLLSEEVESIWSTIDRVDTRTQPASMLAELGDLSTIRLPFRTRYQLEVCLSEGSLGEFNIPREFIEKLLDLGPEKSVDILEGISVRGKQVYDPMSILKEGLPHVSSSFRKLPNSDFTYVYSAVVTPTTIHYNSPVVEISNRVLRRYAHYHDRFLRVKFEEELPRGKLWPGPTDERGGSELDEVYKRIKSTLELGIVIGDRHYEFLGFGSSQFREHGAYFFASLPHLTAVEIRASMGRFQHIKSVSKYAARLGQCFSTTRAVKGARAPVSETPDIWTDDHKYIFTDGVGIISRFMAQLAASEMGMSLPNGEPPSVLQFRSGGAKGILAIHEDPRSPKENRKPMIWIRQSQSKFHADYELLEVVRWSQFSAAHLNRQIITVLYDLGVEDKVFVTMMTRQLMSLNAAMSDQKVALDLLQKQVDRNQITLTMACMIQDGFHATKEPFLMSLLHLWRAWCIKYLKEKAKIPVEAGAILLGCVDEFAVLEGHYHHKQPKNPFPSPDEKRDAVPEVFVQLSQGVNREPEVITGYMILTRNPSLHPGDIRLVRGVDRSELHHLKDVVVLPQTGDRDLGSMCSGGDLDGDDYLVIWDQRLLPPYGSHPPMDYSAPPELILNRDVTMQDIIGFFITYMKNDSVGTIANAHLATADRENSGVKSARCRRLAQLHSRAVDYAKSGHAAQMPPDLRPQKWPHFMNKPKSKTYKSTKVLGQLFDLVECEDFTPHYQNSFDSRILRKFSPTKDMIGQASSIKRQYDVSLRRIMLQYDIHTEFEVFSAFTMHTIKRTSDYKMLEVIGDHSAALKDNFRAACCEAAGGRDFQHIGPFVGAMYEVTWLEMKAHARTANKLSSDGDTVAPPLISFPWIFHMELGRIANSNPADLQALGCANTVTQPVNDTVESDGGYVEVSVDDQQISQPQSTQTPTPASAAISKDIVVPSSGNHQNATSENRAPDAILREVASASLLEQLANQ